MKKRRPSDLERTARTLYDYVLLHPEVLSNKVFRHQLQQLVRLMQLVLHEDEPSLSRKSGRRTSASTNAARPERRPAKSLPQ
ncbi:MAG: hypothetical protein ACHQ9S_26815 [Candidatus Binatia bacterium]